jgi:hypothetical protein
MKYPRQERRPAPLDINDAIAAAIILVTALYLTAHALAWILR